MLTRVKVPVSAHGISGSLLAIVPHNALSGTVLLGLLIVMKILGQWLGLELVAQACRRGHPLACGPARP